MLTSKIQVSCWPALRWLHIIQLRKLDHRHAFQNHIWHGLARLNYVELYLVNLVLFKHVSIVQ